MCYNKFMKNQFKNQQGGFIETIILIVIVLLIMNYLGVTITGTIDWIWGLIQGVF